MSLPVRHQPPPNIKAIEKRFGFMRASTIFTYAPYVYVPSGVKLTKSLEAHERVHLKQQGKKPQWWWERYLVDDDFRLAQEVEAHRAEWRVLAVGVRDRNQISRRLGLLAERLSSPLYGGLVTMGAARRLISEKR